MSAVYLETSAVLRWLLGEPGARRVAAAIETARFPVCSVLTPLEAHRAVLRAVREKRISRSTASELTGLLIRVTSNCSQMEVTDAVRLRAAAPFPVEPVRTLDAIHLATALEFSRALSDLSVLSFDRRMLSNLGPLGLRQTPST